MADNFDKKIKQAKDYNDALEASTKRLKSQEDAVQNLANITGIAFAGFITKIEKSNELRRKELKHMIDAEVQVKNQTKAISTYVEEQFKVKEILNSSTSQLEIFGRTISKIPVDSKKILKEFNNIEEIQKEINVIEENKKVLNDDELKRFIKLKDFNEKYNKENQIAADLESKNLKNNIKEKTELYDLLKAAGVDMSDSLKIKEGLLDLSNAESKFIERAISSGKLNKEQQVELINLQSNKIEAQKILNKSTEIYNEELTNQVSLWKNIGGMIEKNAGNALTSIIDKMGEYDQAVSNAGRDFGFINMKTKSTSDQMAQLTSESAKFGMSVGDTLNMMGDLGDELATIDQEYLADSVEHFTAIEKATGVSSKEISKIAGEMMRSGSSAQDVEDSMEGANQIAKQFGVNTKKVLQGVSRNIDKMRTMGFVGGEESLIRMTATAERLRMNVDEIFDVAKRARTIEGAMDMAAQLQLAGGSFAQIDPMSLLAAARKGPEELQKILTEMGGDIGAFNEDGEFTFDPVDTDRLQIVADATGQTLSSIQRGIQKTAQDNQKIDMLGLGSSLDDNAKGLLSDLTKVKEGKIEMDEDAIDALTKGTGLDIKNVDDLKNLSQADVEILMEKKKQQTKSLKEQAEQNQSFKESITAFKDSVMNLFAIFEPYLKTITGWIQSINEMSPWAKKLVAAIVALVAFGPKLIGGIGKFQKGAQALQGSFKGMKEGKGIFGKMKGAIFGKKDEITGANNNDKTPQGKKGGGLSTLAKGLAKMGGKNVLKGIGNTALAGPALALMILGIPTLLFMNLVTEKVKDGFMSVSSGIASFGNKKNIRKGIAAVALAGLALLVFTPGLIALAGIMLIGLGAVALEIGFQSISTGFNILGKNLTNIAKGALALALIGASMIPFAFAAQIMSDIDWLNVLFGIGVLALVTISLIAVGTMMVAALPLLAFAVAGLILVGIGLFIASKGLLAAGIAFQALSEVNWGGLSEMGSALMTSIPGLVAFSLASIMFLNPLTILGIIAMTATLGALAMVMIPLASSLDIGADGLDRFADGLEKLQKAANSLDFERLEALRNLSMTLAIGAIGGGIMGDTIGKIADALDKISGGTGGNGGTKKIQIDLKLNGRDVKTMIIDDTEIVS